MFETRKTILLVLFCITMLFCNGRSFSQPVTPYNNHKITIIDTGVYIYYEDTSGGGIQKAANARYTKLHNGIINLGIEDRGFWLKFSFTNHYTEKKLLLKIAQPVIDSISLYYADSTGHYTVQQLGEYKPFKERFISSPNYIFPVAITPGNTQVFYVYIKSGDQVQMPVTIGTPEIILYDESKENFIFGIYAGIVLIMCFYNLMVATTVRDKSYLYYILFIIGVGLSQATLRGYAFQYLWPNWPAMARISTLAIPFLSGLTTAAFLKQFLQTKKRVPRWHTGINVFVGLYCIGTFTGLFLNHTLGLKILLFTASSGAVFSLVLGAILIRQKFRPAIFFMIAYSVFLVAVIIFALFNFNLLPYNNFTSHILEIGSAIQITLLSFALADKINIYRKETLQVSMENTRLIQEQNIILEAEVKHRTQELTQTNSNLEQAMTTLKNTQAQLVNAEKMSSLGQLTAGIAHEINNPINFVTANIKPLQLDVQDLRSVIEKYEQIDITKDVPGQLTAIEDYKKQIDITYLQEEIDTLLSGISEGANRTAEIVKGLRNFARVDEDQMKPTDLEKGLDSTLLIIKNKFPSNMQLNREKGNIPLVECMPGKINQVFMNIIANAVDAIKMKRSNEAPGTIEIKTWTAGENVSISITDNGDGMSEKVRNNIFDPFFTTKDVGEGTGLGLSIAQSIINRHNGTIDIVSAEGHGAAFIITLPITHSGTLN